MSEAWIRRLLYLIGASNILDGIAALVSPEAQAASLHGMPWSPDDPIAHFYFQATWINVVAWGLAYVLAGRLAATRTAVLVAGGLGRVANFGACVVVYRAGRGSATLLHAGILDVALAAFFAYVVWVGRTRPAVEA